MGRNNRSSMPPSRPAPDAVAQVVPAPEALQGGGEQAWIEVIRKMDEVYSDLLRYEVALEEKNAALEESQQFIVSVLTSMSDILVVCDRSGAIEDVNGSLCAFSGRRADALVGTSIFDLFADDDARAAAHRMITAHQCDTVFDCELPLRAADGSAVPVSLNCTPRFSAVGKMLGMVVSGRPIGELRRAYKALRDAHEDLKRAQQQLLHSEKMASLGRLVAGVAHELNNPISFILGNVFAMQRYAGRLQSYLEAVHAGVGERELAEMRARLRIDRIIEDLQPLIAGTIEGAERTRDIVDGLKRFSAMDRGESIRFDLVEVLLRAVHWVTKATPDRFQVSHRLPERIEVEGSPGQMQHVFMNLVQNASDATTELERPRLEIEANVTPQRVELRFADNGPGIGEAHLKQIFDPFFTTKPVGKGTGLGLAISYGIVERHKGTLSVANRDHGGAVFTLSLPLAR